MPNRELESRLGWCESNRRERTRRATGESVVTVNTVAPGMVVTENIHKRLTDEQIHQKLELFPLRRAANADEVAECVVNTLRCGAMTGETVNINSGFYFSAWVGCVQYCP